ncbi:hypothetical protein I4I73_21085 [Pseudonocardia sp. KRD-184]|uniref:Amino acid permease/ SLC12A domain-containing protein n=1 Tax=Pseudonocardia oceani TaxID=2792013 RepID=A0ABS6UGT9_9PSEU|nr:hypothetical protein [Pseudonocardia oceani]MBW0092190.1 hypothetical protein [Pseudonocardia oceani]MBW0098485.1 hypothetical protein [Pseudonocardia oceani]MBW0111041.1 hypothetical protein [Pseudonocardia oceani]MBW0123628.1 hypothetical protein [Pseudonocardia oceani]MBW0131455.1 hypothetical protein [Pseudonocardia oceani]
MTVLALFHIGLTAKALGVLAVGVLAVGGAEGFSLRPLNPVEIFDNPAAVGVFGGGAARIALFAAFWSWVGFEIVTGSFACAQAFYDTGARYAFSLAREGVLPAALARVSATRSPVPAAMPVTAIVARRVPLVDDAGGPDPRRSGDGRRVRAARRQQVRSVRSG